MLRGIERGCIFRDDEDREDFVRRLDRLLPELGFRCFAWVLMDNHVHLVLQTGAVPVSRLMARLNTGYVCRFNQRHDRVGHLLQNRFRSRLVQDEEDLRGLVGYVHANPVTAGRIESELELRELRWCGHGALMGSRPPLPFECVAGALDLFDEDPTRARDAIRAAIEDRSPPGAPRPTQPEDPWAQGSSSAEAGRLSEPLDACPVAAATPTISQIEEAACLHFGIEPRALRSGTRNATVVRARAAVAFGGLHVLGLRGVELAARLSVSPAAISRAATRGRRDYEGIAELAKPPNR